MASVEASTAIAEQLAEIANLSDEDALTKLRQRRMGRAS
jgi:hypothetical protein